MFPGPNLNLIIGPNGSGKSTIVCAICLGLAGKPSILGRAGNIADYIQNNFNKARIEIDLHHNERQKVCIAREINRTGSSTWRLNGNSSNLKGVEEAVRSMDIQVNNLCQFLPQDRVAEFAKMSPQELLADTQKAIGLDDLYNKHMQLKKLREEQKSVELSVKTSSDHLEREIEKNTRLEQEVKNYQEREEHIQNIDQLKKYKMWLEYDAKRDEYQTKKREMLTKRGELQEVRARDAPLKKKVGDLGHEMDQINANFKALAANLATDLSKMGDLNQKTEVFNDKIDEIEEDLKARKQDEEHRIKSMNNLNAHINGLKEELAKYQQDKQEIQEKFTENSELLTSLTARISEIQNEVVNYDARRQNMGHEIRAVDNNIKRIQDMNARQLAILREKNNSAYRAVLWLRENKHQFRKPIYEPIMTMIAMHDIKNAKFIENHVPYYDMIAFVVEDKQDMDKFMRIINDEMGLKVNATLVPREKLDTFVSNRPIQHYNRWGFESYLKDLFTAPDGVMRYLCRQYNIHNIPIGTRQTEECLERVFSDTPFKRFYTPSRSYSSKTSKFGQRLRSTMSYELKAANLLTAAMDVEQLNELTLQKNDLMAESRNIENQIREFRTKEQELTIQQEKCRKERKELQAKQSYGRTVTNKLAQKESNLQDLQRRLVGLEQIEATAYTQVLKFNAKKLLVLQDIVEQVKKRLSNAKEKVKMAFKLNVIAVNKSEAESQLAEANRASHELERQVQQLTQDVSRAKAQAQQKLHVAKTQSSIDTLDNLRDSLKEQFPDLPQTLEEIESKIKQEQVKAECMSETDKNVVQEFKARKNDIEKMQKEAEKSKTNFDTYQTQIEELKNDWLPHLEEILSKINVNFAQFFSRLQCVGEVSLKMGENQLDFDQYGVCIKIKFRKNEPLHELTAFHQSGGERSVSTVLYMMALQELTKVPFRCVDEINQGMDAKNERKVFQFVVETACRKNTSQYFLLTPKLLPDLMYSENMTQHIIYNGIGVSLKSEEWSLKKFIKRAARLDRDDA